MEERPARSEQSDGALGRAEVEWHALALAAEVPDDGTGMTFEVGARRVALFRHAGRLHAIDDQCPHRGASLGMGVVLDGEVTCPWHAFHFALETGCNTDGLPDRVEVFPLRVAEDGRVEGGISGRRDC